MPIEIINATNQTNIGKVVFLLIYICIIILIINIIRNITYFIFIILWELGGEMGGALSLSISLLINNGSGVCRFGGCPISLLKSDCIRKEGLWSTTIYKASFLIKAMTFKGRKSFSYSMTKKFHILITCFFVLLYFSNKFIPQSLQTHQKFTQVVLALQSRI